MGKSIFDDTRYVYAIYPYDENGQIAGAYVGITGNLKERMYLHRNNRDSRDKQSALHKLMREHGYCFQILEVCNKVIDRCVEYDWIEFFAGQEVHVFNIQHGKNANQERLIKKYGKPIWTGGGVAWQ